LVKIFEREPLKSELSAMDKFVTTLKEKGGTSVDQAPTSDAETAYLASYRSAVDSGELPVLPRAWGGFETVVVVSVRAPRGAPGSHTSGGMNAKLLFNPPSREPVYSSLYGTRWGEPLEGGVLARWVIEHAATKRAEQAAPNTGTAKKDGAQ
jgi:hypothetical protein